MGFQTTLVIKNDALNEIDSDPVGWWEVTRNLINRHFGSIVQSYGFKSHSNAFEVASVTHADVTSVIAVGQNHTTVLGQYYRQDHHSQNCQIELLKKLADERGYRLVKKKVTPKT